MLYSLLASLFLALCYGKEDTRYDHEIHGVSRMTKVMQLITEDRVQCRLNDQCPTVVPSVVNQPTQCVNGMAGEYPCNNMNLLSFISLADLGYPASSGNDIWGWQSSATGRYYALAGTTQGTAMIDISDPVNPTVVGTLNSELYPSQVTWRDIKIRGDYAYIVADDFRRSHGMQVVDLLASEQITQGSSLVNITTYTGFGNCHNIVIDPQYDYAYGVGSNTCSGGLHVVDISDPANPTFVACYNNDAYSHDAECVTYNKPGFSWSGHRVCFGYNEDRLSIVDVEDPSNPTRISITQYPNSAYTHQGWINANQEFIFMNDELDENNYGFNTRTHLFDTHDLASVQYRGYFQSPFPVIDHNLYYSTFNSEEYVFMSNYEAGTIIYKPSSDYTSVEQVGYFDTYPSRNSRSFNGQWSNFPMWSDVSINGYTGIVIAQDINRGFYVLQYDPSLNQATTTIPLTTV